MLFEDFDKKHKYSSVTFFTHKLLSSVLFVSSSCVNLLILLVDWETTRNESGSKEGQSVIAWF